MICSFSALEALCYCLSRLSMNRRLFQHLPCSRVVFREGKKRILRRSDYHSGESVRNGLRGFTVRVIPSISGCMLRRTWSHGTYKTYRRFCDRPPICQARISTNLERTIDGVPAAFYLAVTYVLSALVLSAFALNTFSIRSCLKYSTLKNPRDKHGRFRYEMYDAMVFLPHAATKSRSGQLLLDACTRHAFLKELSVRDGVF